jgi:hypothetical protein
MRREPKHRALDNGCGDPLEEREGKTHVGEIHIQLVGEKQEPPACEPFSEERDGKSQVHSSSIIGVWHILHKHPIGRSACDLLGEQSHVAPSPAGEDTAHGDSG